HADLGPVLALPNDHDPLDRLAPGEELGLGDDRWPPPAAVATLAPALPLGFEPGRTLDALDVVVRRRGLLLRARLADVDDRLDAGAGGAHLSARPVRHRRVRPGLRRPLPRPSWRRRPQPARPPAEAGTARQSSWAHAFAASARRPRPAPGTPRWGCRPVRPAP